MNKKALKVLNTKVMTKVNYGKQNQNNFNNKIDKNLRNKHKLRNCKVLMQVYSKKVNFIVKNSQEIQC
jgi:hypothetical protein